MYRQKLTFAILVILLMGLYFFGHNTGESRENLIGGILFLAQAALDLGASVLILSISAGVGRRSLRMMDFSRLTFAERAALECSVGLGVVSIYALLMGLAGFFNGLLWVGLLLASPYYIRATLEILREAWRARLQYQPADNLWVRFIRGLALVLLLAGLIMALAPPVAWDAMAYHLPVPQRYLQEGAIRQHLDIHFFGFPQAAEMHYALLMLATGADRAAAVLHFGVGVIGLGALLGFLKRQTSSKAAYTAVLVLLSSYNLWQLFTIPYVELFLFLYSIVAVIALTEYHANDTQQRVWLILLGVLGGFAGGVKYTAFPLILGLYVAIVWNDRRHLLRNTLIFGAAGAAAFAAWMLKGALLYGNPVYPYLFESINWDATRALNFNEADKGLIHSGLIFQLQIPFLPFAATLFGIDKVTPYRFTSGAFLLTLPFALLMSRQQLPNQAKRLLAQLLPLAITMLLFWTLIATFSGIGGQVRLMVVMLPLAAILGALAYYNLEQWARYPLDVVFILQSALIIALIFGIFDHLNAFVRSQALAYHVGAISKADYLDANLGRYSAMLRALEPLPADSTVQFLWEPKTYYCPPHITCRADLLFDAWARPLQMGATPDELLARWQIDGVDYFMLNDGIEGYRLWLAYHSFAYEQNVLFPTFFDARVDELWADGVAYRLYTWKTS